MIWLPNDRFLFIGSPSKVQWIELFTRSGARLPWDYTETKEFKRKMNLSEKSRTICFALLLSAASKATLNANQIQFKWSHVGHVHSADIFNIDLYVLCDLQNTVCSHTTIIEEMQIKRELKK